MSPRIGHTGISMKFLPGVLVPGDVVAAVVAAAMAKGRTAAVLRNELTKKN